MSEVRVRRGAPLLTIMVEGSILSVYRGREEMPTAIVDATGHDWRSEAGLWDDIEAAVRQARLDNELRVHRGRRKPKRSRRLAHPGDP